MTLFKISCDTCQTSLNVRQESAIGQILACPKCGSMVQVAPPADWESSEQAKNATSSVKRPSRKRPFVKPVPDPDLPETQSSISGSVSEGLQEKLQRRADEKAAGGAEKPDLVGRWQGTDEVPEASSRSDISKDNVATKTRSKENSTGRKAGKNLDAVVAPPKQDMNDNDPVLPGDQWSSAKSRQQKKMLAIFAGTIAILIFGIGAVVLAVIQLGGDGSDGTSQIADVNDSLEPKPKPEEPSPASKSGILKNSPDNFKKSQDSKQKNNAATSEPNSDTEKSPNDIVSKPVNPPAGVSGSDAKSDTKRDLNDEGKGDSETDIKKGKSPSKDLGSNQNGTGTDASADSDGPPGFVDGDDDTTGAVGGLFDDIADFTVFETDAELLRARNQFKENDLGGIYGATRFFVERSLKKMPDPSRSINVPIAAVKFQQTTLLEFLDFFYQGTGVAVAVDVTPIILAGIRLDEKFDVLATGKTFIEILRQVADERGLSLNEKGKHSLILTIPNRDVLVAKEYSAADLAGDAQELQTLMELIQRYINKESWSQVGGKGIVTANEKNNSIFVEHYGWAQVRVAEILKHIRAARGLALVTKNANLGDNTNRLALSEDSKGAILTLFESDPISLSRLFAKVAKASNVHVFINWEATGEQFLPSGSLPLAIDSEPFDQIIVELAEAMKLGIVWHSTNVVELTTEYGASSNLTFESYDISKAVQPGSTPERLLAAIKKLLSENKIADFKKAEIGLDPLDNKTLYAVLPQEAHQNVRRIVSFLKSK